MDVLDPSQLWILVSALVAVLALGVTIFAVTKRKRREELPPPVTAVPSHEPKLEAPSPVPTPPVPEAAPDLTKRLERTRGSLLSRLGKFMGRSSLDAIPPQEWDEVEEALLEGDVGPQTTTKLLAKIKARILGKDTKSLREMMREETETLLVSGGLPHGARSLSGAPKPLVISIVGVNGTGKTTTIGKLAARFTGQGQSVLLGAGDTFRAAAIQQLKVWADRAGAQFVTGREGADPGAVAFDSIAAGKARGVDVVLLDTAGRLHTKSNLMEELKKVHRVMKKVIPEAPHETWLVVDGTTGQNAIQQAREFQKEISLSGVIVTKLDGTAKGGAILGIVAELNLPVRYIGVGEQAADLIPFEPRPFIDAILGE